MTKFQKQIMYIVCALVEKGPYSWDDVQASVKVNKIEVKNWCDVRSVMQFVNENVGFERDYVNIMSGEQYVPISAENTAAKEELERLR